MSVTKSLSSTAFNNSGVDQINTQNTIRCHLKISIKALHASESRGYLFKTIIIAESNRA